MTRTVSKADEGLSECGLAEALCRLNSQRPLLHRAFLDFNIEAAETWPSANAGIRGCPAAARLSRLGPKLSKTSVLIRPVLF
jgi:hypothetical protein